MSFTKPTLPQALGIAAGALLFAVFGCLGAIAGFSGSNSAVALGWLGGAVFVAAGLVFIYGAIAFIILLISAIFKNRDGGK